ncbi:MULTISPECIES: cytochrome P450 [unclassified Mycobacterium]|uniref:cytochrome P450 n=1 Tax=unclassified Mycobacterium TaxID=2642494 RepID=UPI0008020A7D|nr:MULTISPECIES: cytochrome P450 [unclassified Mycobacterium]OBH05072.1 monooxygenase [Mycobacterium sp. E2699]OBI49415.1 monooxygenase [Mycobacterium sp. E787]
MRRVPQDVAVYRANLYTRTAVLDPYPHYGRLRRLGSVVWLRRHGAYALPRYAECKAALRDDATFISGNGVALNPISNRLSRGTTLNSDGAEHDRRRKLVAHRLLPRALRDLAGTIDDQAAAIVDTALGRRTVDAVADLASALPLAVVPDLVGWPRDERGPLIDWGGATFDMLGPLNRQAVMSFPRSLQMLRFARRVVRSRTVLEGSIVDELLASVDAGTVSREQCTALMIDYIAPSLDTTISAISNAVYLFASHPEQWQLLRDNPGLIPNAVNEIVRYESPLRAFARLVRRDTEIAGVLIPAGSRVLVMYASANRDEREWKDPDTFDIRRDAGRHLGFGNGAHACAGQALARLETAAMLRALIDRVQRIHVTGRPTWALNNIIRRHQSLPVTLEAA